MNKAILTLYTVTGNPEQIKTTIQKLFQSVTQKTIYENEKVILILQDDSQIIFTPSHQSDKPEFISSHTSGMANFFAQADTKNIELKMNVIRQIQCFNCVTGITFELNENEDRTHFIMNTLYGLATEVNGFLLYPNMHIYTGQGKLLFSSKGETELTEFTPIANADLLDFGRPEETEADKKRCQRSITQLKKKGIPYMEHLRCEVVENETILKSREEMIQRAIALFTVSVYSEVMLSDQPDRDCAMLYVNKMDELYGAKAYFSPLEKAYIDNPSPDHQTCIQFVWRYEGCGVLLWAAGVIDDLPYPSEIIDIPVLAAIYWQHKNLKDLSSKGLERTANEILDAADLTMRYDWACLDARIHNKKAPASLDSGIVVERHYAFNWIIGANNGTGWDKIQPNT